MRGGEAKLDIRTKVITTIIAMICSVSVSAAGIAAVMLEFPISVSNTSVLAAADISGNLYGQRFGADDYDTPVMHLYKSGTGIDQEKMTEFTEDVNFSSESKQIDYIFKFILDSDAESGVIVKLTKGMVTDALGYENEYKIAYGKEEPNWSEAEDITVNRSYVIDSNNAYVWLKASLKTTNSVYQRLDGSATWTFVFSFEGIAEQVA